MTWHELHEQASQTIKRLVTTLSCNFLFFLTCYFLQFLGPFQVRGASLTPADLLDLLQMCGLDHWVWLWSSLGPWSVVLEEGSKGQATGRCSYWENLLLESIKSQPPILPGYRVAEVGNLSCTVKNPTKVFVECICKFLRQKRCVCKFSLLKRCLCKFLQQNCCF